MTSLIAYQLEYFLTAFESINFDKERCYCTSIVLASIVVGDTDASSNKRKYNFSSLRPKQLEKKSCIFVKTQ